MAKEIVTPINADGSNQRNAFKFSGQKKSNFAEDVKPTRIQSRSHSPDGTLMRLPEVEEMVGVKTTTIYKWMKDGKFPKPLKMGFVSLWVRAEITAWIEEKAQQRFDRSSTARTVP